MICEKYKNIMVKKCFIENIIYSEIIKYITKKDVDEIYKSIKKPYDKKYGVNYYEVRKNEIDNMYKLFNKILD